MMRILPVVVALLLAAAPVLAAPSAMEVTLADIFAPAATPAAGSGKEPGSGLPEPGIAADCTAHCQNGSTVTCSGTSCNAVDYSCSTGQRGYCTAGGTTKYCPLPTCPRTCTASCANAGGGSVSCTSPTGTCFAIDNCYANCDENYYLCPSPGWDCPF